MCIFTVPAFCTHQTAHENKMVDLMMSVKTLLPAKQAYIFVPSQHAVSEVRGIT